MESGNNFGRVVILSVMALVVGAIAALWMLARPGNPGGQNVAATAPATAVESRPDAPLEIAVENAAAPWSQSDGKGCANDIVLAAYEAVNVKVKFTVLPYARAKEMAMNGEIAACFAMSWQKEFEGKILFADDDKPLYICTPTFVRNLAAPAMAKSVAEIAAGTKVGTVIEYEYTPAIAALPARGVIFESAKDEVSNLKKLALGRIDLAIVNIDDLKTADLLFAKAGVAGQVGIAFETEALPSHIGFSVAHPRGAFARAKFNEGFAIIRKDGTLKRILAEWRGRQ